MPVVVTQQAAQMLPTLNFTQASAYFLPRLDQPVLKPLMIAFSMIVTDVGTNRPAKHVLAKENHPAQAFLAQASPKSLQMSIEIGRMRRQADRLNSGVPENSAKPFTELGVPVHEKIALPQTSIVVKSTAARTSQCALRKVCQVVWRLRWGTGSMPCSFKILATSGKYHGPGWPRCLESDHSPRWDSP